MKAHGHIFKTAKIVPNSQSVFESLDVETNDSSLINTASIPARPSTPSPINDSQQCYERNLIRRQPELPLYTGRSAQALKFFKAVIKNAEELNSHAGYEEQRKSLRHIQQADMVRK